MKLLDKKRKDTKVKAPKRAQIKLDHMRNDINRAKIVPSKNISLMYCYNNNINNVVIMEKDKKSVSMLPVDRMNEIRLGEKGISTTLNAINKKISMNQVKNVHSGYNKYWTYGGAIYGVKPGYIGRLDTGSTPSATNVYDAHYYQEQWYLGWGSRDDSSNLYDTKRLTNFKTKNMYHYSVTNAWYVNGNPYGFCYPIGGWAYASRWPTSTVYMNNHILTSRLQIYLNNKKINRSMIVAGTSYNSPDTTEIDGHMNGMYSCVRNKTYLLRNHRLIYWVRTFYVVFCEEAGYNDRMCCYPYNSPYIYMSSLGWY